MSTSTRPSPARGLWAVPIVLVVVLIVALVVTLAHVQPHLTGSNSVPLHMQGIGLTHGQVACQGSQLLPKGSGRMRMFISAGSAGGKPQASMTIRQRQDGLVARSRGHWIAPDKHGINLGKMDFPIDPPVRKTRTDAYVCIRNTGRFPIVLTGVISTFGNVRLGDRHLDIALTTLWYTPKSTSWFGDLGAIIPRVGHARIGGVWAFWAAGLLLLAALGAALATAIRENTP